MRSRLKIERRNRNFSATYVASIVGLSKSGYLNIEAGRRKPSINVAFKLERFFGIPASELLAESEPDTSL